MKGSACPLLGMTVVMVQAADVFSIIIVNKTTRCGWKLIMYQNYHFLLNFMRIADMLSIPYSELELSLLISSSNSSYRIFPKGFFSYILRRM